MLSGVDTDSIAVIHSVLGLWFRVEVLRYPAVLNRAECPVSSGVGVSDQPCPNTKLWCVLLKM